MEHRITNLKEYENTILEIQKNGDQMWFRGHSSANFRLEPSLHRLKKRIRPLTEKLRDFKLTRGDVVMPNEWALRNEFKHLYELTYPDKHLGDMECLYLMQHYGINTRLLDFSRDPKVALFFALSERPIKYPPDKACNEMPVMDYDLADYDAAVYCINPLTINEEAHGLDEIIEIDKSWRPFLEKMYSPLAIKTSFDDRRITAQKGVFILFGSHSVDLESIYWQEQHIHKIVIPNEYILCTYRELRASGLTHFSVYPDLRGKAMDLNEEMINRLDARYDDLISRLDPLNDDENQAKCLA
ncbi:FRG domain-containing protein [Desertivirga xinjiangensis]|uniref:FRG domain-containing protein n=1 Tax=Desertivirga xinjiangensis TaxID=539206 RepID=UPI00210B1C72|nr:FRG domain-containing protein [Pedobacter xinjiangensis]